MKKVLIAVSLMCAIVTAQAKNYKGAELYSNDTVLYGRFEMLLQAAPGSGQLSTFFLYRNSSELNTTLWEEIDLEIFGKDFRLQPDTIKRRRQSRSPNSLRLASC